MGQTVVFNERYAHKKFNSAHYGQQKFEQREQHIAAVDLSMKLEQKSMVIDVTIVEEITVECAAKPLFRPYAFDENTSRKRRPQQQPQHFQRQQQTQQFPKPSPQLQQQKQQLQPAVFNGFNAQQYTAGVHHTPQLAAQFTRVAAATTYPPQQHIPMVIGSTNLPRGPNSGQVLPSHGRMQPNFQPNQVIGTTTTTYPQIVTPTTPSPPPPNALHYSPLNQQTYAILLQKQQAAFVARQQIFNLPHQMTFNSNIGNHFWPKQMHPNVIYAAPVAYPCTRN